MKIFEMEQVSLYCTDVKSLDDLCSIYQSSSRYHGIIFGKEHHFKQIKKIDTEEITQRLSKLALDFNNRSGMEMPLVDEPIDTKKLHEKKYQMNLMCLIVG